MSRDQVTNLSVNILNVHPDNTKYFDDIEGETYERFKRSIEEDGIITPLIVAPDMTIISGHQRYQAAKDLGIQLVPVIIRDELIDEDERMRKLLAANFGRVENNPMKQSRVISKYEELMGIKVGRPNSENFSELTQSDLAEQLGVTPKTLQELKRLQNLSPELQQLIEDGEVRYTTALNVWGKLSNEEQAKFIEEMGREQISNITARETQELMNKYKATKEELDVVKSRKPEVIEKRVVPEDYEELKGSQKAMQDKIQQLEAANAGLNSEYEKLADEINEVDKKSKKYDELNKAMESMNTKLNDGQRRLRAQKEVYDLIKAGEKAVEELAPLSYLIDGTSITGNDYARDPIIKLADNLDKISSRLRKSVGNTTIIEG